MGKIILLQTDFSLKDSSVSSMRGVITKISPDSRIEDICHDIKKFDTFEASLSLASVLPYWPDDVVAVSVVDPGVGTERKASAALLNDGKIVITPDNGTLTHLKYSPGIASIREIDSSIRYNALEEVSVFHGRDIFGYAAALLASGRMSFEKIGKEYPVSEVVECPEYNTRPEFKDLKKLLQENFKI